MYEAKVTPVGDRVRWVELPGTEPPGDCAAAGSRASGNAWSACGFPEPYLRPGNSGPLLDAQHLVHSGAKLMMVPGTGHTVMFDDPEAFAQAVFEPCEQSASRVSPPWWDGFVHVVMVECWLFLCEFSS
ncbi:hypothetical protein [Actinocrispum sp. NPDC049592]|uniref:alpha/beta fold hydrolase n=1 Tax=Actinocrispum sp. NPDC049592 TaxID=3154835 RepID=UPI00341568E9